MTTEGFELSDGRFYPHPIPLEEDELPTVQEFQDYYDHWFNLLSRNTTDDREIVNHH
ncbi:hypothetical protein VKI21_04790 [Cyanobacterium aponinum UTEX 3222]|uniref:hypothetical protein n=1 Tax=Cyanobacterium aponinum TaxID=379064 RepID=UPI003093E2D2|nr:hypothetical protein VKI21_12575 [Cyanobacterium aponinum UTEX 3222]WRL42388.1 hypothetical protein VKI21_01515 [Cyanobacterium aponinum UTEX 3222]WRL43002.1 hypothetical protein VKI21_04790 [Cyanobacterium aponinum UTEX 3222]